MRAVSIDGREQLQQALDCMTDRSHKQGGWAREQTECPELQAREEGGGAAGGALSRHRKSPKRDLAGKPVSVVLDSGLWNYFVNPLMNGRK